MHHFGIDPRKFPPRSNAATTSVTRREFVQESVDSNLTDLEWVSETFDTLINDLQTMTVHSAVEKSVSKLVNANDAILWIFNDNFTHLTSPRSLIKISKDDGIIGCAISQGVVVSCLNPKSHKAFNPDIDKKDISTMYIPLSDKFGQLVGVVQAFRNKFKPAFTEADENLATRFVRKFKEYSDLFAFKQSNNSIEEKISSSCSSGATTNDTINLIKEVFKCHSVEFFLVNIGEGCAMKFNTDSGSFEAVPDGFAGVIAESVTSGSSLSSKDISKYPVYNAQFDGVDYLNILVCSCYCNNNSSQFFIVLRRETKDEYFTLTSEKIVSTVLPDIAQVITDCKEMTGVAAQLYTLLESAEHLSSQLDVDSLVRIIMQRATTLLKCERCSLYIVDEKSNELVTFYHGGPENPIKCHISHGIIGHVISAGHVVNIPDAYSDPRFDPSMDEQTGFRTKTILATPITNNKGEILAAIELVNHIDQTPFNESDIRLMLTFNLFCGIALDNARLYRFSLNLTKQIRGLANMSADFESMGSPDINKFLDKMFELTKQLIKVQTITLFVSEEESLKPYIHIGKAVSHGDLFAKSVKDGKTRLYESEDVEDAIKSGEVKISPSSSNESSSIIHATSIFSGKVSLNTETNPTNQIRVLVIPLTRGDGDLLGVLELDFLGQIHSENMKLIEAFSVYINMSLEKTELIEVYRAGSRENMLSKWVSTEERTLCKIPEKLTLTDEESEKLLSLDFFSPDWSASMGFFKIILFIYNRFGLLEEFNIPSQVLFNFITDISRAYNAIPYHNWKHAVDVTQYIAYEIITAQLEEKLTKFEILALVTAAICHDANHDGFTNVFNVMAETPLSILFKDQSVMETQHCSAAIKVLTQKSCNIFESLNPSDNKSMWSLIIDLIIGTDMTRYSKLIEDVNARLESGPLDFAESEDRKLVLHILLKCADISNVSRPFEIADKWCDLIYKELYGQDDAEKDTDDAEPAPSSNDKLKTDKPRSQIGFYNFICLPLFQTAAKMIPELQVNTDAIMSNLEMWKSLIGDQPAE